MDKNTILDPSIKVGPSKEMLELLKRCSALQSDVPLNVKNALKSIKSKAPESTGHSSSTSEIKERSLFNVDVKLYNSLLAAEDCTENAERPAKAEGPKDNKGSSKSSEPSGISFELSDLCWLNQFLKQLRAESKEEIYLHRILEGCTIKLPENEIIERNPELEARCQKLKQQQQNRDYMRMTKNVDSITRDLPEDTIAYQMKALNKQIIAVVQFVTSVIAGFVFGFLGIQLIVGDLEFGFRLLLGIICALVIAIAEMYFLAKKLNEYDVISDTDITQKKAVRKPHFD